MSSEGFYSELEQPVEQVAAGIEDVAAGVDDVAETGVENVEKVAEGAEEEVEAGAEEAEEVVDGFTNFGPAFSLMEFVKRLLKYLVEGLVVAIAAYTIPAKKLDLQEVGVIALSAAATFALLDLFAPTISYAARQGAGFGMGANLVGFPKF